MELWFPHQLPWLAAGEAPATALRDLNAKGNALSFFSTSERIDVERIVVAIAAARTKPAAEELGYSVFELGDDEAEYLGIVMEKSPGDTPDNGVNELHYNVEHLSARQVAGLAGFIARGTLDNVLPKRIEEVIRKGIEDGTLNQSQLNKKFLAGLAAPTTAPPE